MKAILSLSLVLASTGLQADPSVIIKQRAKDIRDQNNAQQGVPPRPVTQPAATPQRPIAPGSVQLVATPAQQSLNRFQADLASIKKGATLDAAARQKLTADLLGAATGVKPGAGTIERFITSVHKAVAANPLPAAARAKLAVDLDAILNPSKYPQAKMDAIFEDIRSVFQANGTSVVEAADIAATTRLMAAEVRK